jgi:hypothetical protein
MHQLNGTRDLGADVLGRAAFLGGAAVHLALSSELVAQSYPAGSEGAGERHIGGEVVTWRDEAQGKGC